jgi:hypothetical protein
MESLRIRSKFEVLHALPFALVWGGGWTYCWLYGVDEAARRYADGRAIGDAMAMLVCLTLIAFGLLCVGSMLRDIREPYEVRLNDHGALDVVGWIGRTRIWPGQIRAIWTMITEGGDGDSEFVRIIHSRGYFDVPRSECSEELISLLTSRNPNITVQRKW